MTDEAAPVIPVPDEMWDAFQSDITAAEDKYRTLVGKLPPAALIGLWHIVRARVAVVADEGRREAIAQGYRPPGTTIGR